MLALASKGKTRTTTVNAAAVKIYRTYRVSGGGGGGGNFFVPVRRLSTTILEFSDAFYIVIFYCFVDA